MDTCDMLLQQEISIGAKETATELAARMSEAGAPLMLETLRGLESGAVQPRPQNHQQASMAPMLKKEDGRIDWNLSSQQIFNRMRGFTPWPGATTSFRDQGCQVWGEPFPAVQTIAPGHQPGTLLVDHGDVYQNWLVVCGNATILRLAAVKLEGRKQITAAEFANGARLTSGDSFK
jgi:methionyl-tRNA formyltransferase